MFEALVPFQGYAVEQTEGQQPLDAPVDAEEHAPVSEPPRESESSFMNRALRQLGGWFRGDDADDSGEAASEPGGDQRATEDAPERAEPETYTRDQLEAERRRWQSQKDQEVLGFKRSSAVDAAEAGDLGPIRKLAEAGDRWAKQQLEERGDTWALGEIHARELQAEREQTAVAGQVQAIGLQFDQAYLETLLAALPDPKRAAAIRAGTVGLEGRAKAVEAALGDLKKHWQTEAMTTALGDEDFVGSLFKSDAWRLALVKSPVVRKQLSALYRGEAPEADLAPGVGPGRGGEREADVMNDQLRRMWQQVDAYAPEERAAMAGGTNGRLTNRDLLSDDD